MHFAHPDYPKSLRPACMTIRRNRGPVFGIKTTLDTTAVTCESCKRTKVYRAASVSKVDEEFTWTCGICHEPNGSHHDKCLTVGCEGRRPVQTAKPTGSAINQSAEGRK